MCKIPRAGIGIGISPCYDADCPADVPFRPAITWINHGARIADRHVGLINGEPVSNPRATRRRPVERFDTIESYPRTRFVVTKWSRAAIYSKNTELHDSLIKVQSKRSRGVIPVAGFRVVGTSSDATQSVGRAGRLRRRGPMRSSWERPNRAGRGRDFNECEGRVETLDSEMGGSLIPSGPAYPSRRGRSAPGRIRGPERPPVDAPLRAD
jgi:hypothetical protein